MVFNFFVDIASIVFLPLPHLDINVVRYYMIACAWSQVCARTGSIGDNLTIALIDQQCCQIRQQRSDS